MPELFVWYHADPDHLPAYRAWFEHIQTALGISGRLLIRHEKERCTMMEIYSNVSQDMQQAIAAHAAKQHIFQSIERHCERFEALT